MSTFLVNTGVNTGSVVPASHESAADVSAADVVGLVPDSVAVFNDFFDDFFDELHEITKLPMLPSWTVCNALGLRVVPEDLAQFRAECEALAQNVRLAKAENERQAEINRLAEAECKALEREAKMLQAEVEAQTQVRAFVLRNRAKAKAKAKAQAKAKAKAKAQALSDRRKKNEEERKPIKELLLKKMSEPGITLGDATRFYKDWYEKHRGSAVQLTDPEREAVANATGIDRHLIKNDCRHIASICKRYEYHPDDIAIMDAWINSHAGNLYVNSDDMDHLLKTTALTQAQISLWVENKRCNKAVPPFTKQNKRARKM
jgi:hypothetical protein